MRRSGADRERADDRGAVEPLAGRGDHVAAAGRDVDAGHRRGVADPVAELGGHPQGDGGRALGDAQALPDLVGVEAVRADRGLLAQVGEQRRALDGLGRQRRASPPRGARTALGGAPASRSQSPTESRSSRVASGCDHGSSGSTVAASCAERAPRRRRSGRRARAPGEPVAEHAARRPAPRCPRRAADGNASTSVSPSSSTSPRYAVCTGPTTSPPSCTQPAVGELGLLDAAAGPVARLEHDHVGAGRGEVAGGRQAREPGAQHRDVVPAHSASRQATSSRSGPRS